MRAQKAEEILDAAEKLARSGGYGGFSFRDLARGVGIKSASVHYHFPTKEDLGIAMTQRYNERFIHGLGDPRGEGTVDEKIGRYVNAFRTSMIEDRLMCLCGLFGAEVTSLPGNVAEETRVFFERNRDWLMAVLADDTRFADDDARERAALTLIAKLQGAMIMARTMIDVGVFETILEDPLG